ncbi:hypothetical protein KAW43_00145 [Candidatus Parcubacteria bacterium]|nr:hypothetical protein [Candidatus Parcubacteria bacterium]
MKKRGNKEIEAEEEKEKTRKDVVAMLEKVMSLQNSGFTKIEFFQAVEDERVKGITIAMLIEVASDKDIFYVDKNFSLFLIALLEKRWNDATTKEKSDIKTMLFWAACESNLDSVKKRAAEAVENLVARDEIIELSNNFLAAK